MSHVATLDPAPTRYDHVMISAHWIMTALIVGNYAGGLSVDFFPKPLHPPIVNLHAVIGATILILAVLRLVWRATHTPPPMPASMGPLFRLAAHVGHGLLYILMFATPITGLRAYFLNGGVLNFGLFQIASPLETNKELAHQVIGYHEYAAHLLVAVAAGHLAVALYHQLVLRDNIMAREGVDRG